MKKISREEAIKQKLPRYFTGKPCKRGHVSERNIHGKCIGCQRLEIYNPKYREMRKLFKRTYSKTPEQLAYQREYHAKYRLSEKMKKYEQSYYQKNKDHLLEMARKAYAAKKAAKAANV